MPHPVYTFCAWGEEDENSVECQIKFLLLYTQLSIFLAHLNELLLLRALMHHMLPVSYHSCLLLLLPSKSQRLLGSGLTFVVYAMRLGRADLHFDGSLHNPRGLWWRTKDREI